MEVKTFRAKSMQEALHLVRQELGPSAAVLHTREVGNSGLLGWIPGRRRIEVTASTGVCVPSRMTTVAKPQAETVLREVATQHTPLTTHQELKGQLTELQSMVEELCRRSHRSSHDLPAAL